MAKFIPVSRKHNRSTCGERFRGGGAFFWAGFTED